MRSARIFREPRLPADDDRQLRVQREPLVIALLLLRVLQVAHHVHRRGVAVLVLAVPVDVAVLIRQISPMRLVDSSAKAESLGMRIMRFLPRLFGVA
jgi:hypothetical protein